MPSTTLVTGGAGFIGSHLVAALAALAARGDRVRVLDDFSTGKRSNLPGLDGKVDILEGDVRSEPACRGAMTGVSTVFHLAALASVPRSVDDPAASHEINATGTLTLLRAAREAGVRRFVYSSTSAAYGPEPSLPSRESDPPLPISPYAVSKLAGEHYCTAFFHCYGMETVSLRYFNVFGPRQAWTGPYANAIPVFTRALLEGRPAPVFGDGKQTRDFVYVDDVVQANLAAAESKAAPGRFYNVASGVRLSVLEMIDLIAGALGVKPAIEFRPPRVGDVLHTEADIARIRQDLGYVPGVPPREGIRRTVEWLAAHRD
jgi:nucleoside-diphosphate-sugar epimerase